MPVTGNWCALFCGISMHSLSIIIVPFVWCQISFFDSWPYLRVLLQLLKSMFFTSMVYIFPALMISIASSSVNALIHFLTSQLFIPVTNLQKISSLFNTYIKQPVDSNFCGLFLVSIFPSSWLTLLNKQCSTTENVGFYVIPNW